MAETPATEFDRSVLDEIAASLAAADLDRLLDRAASELPLLAERMQAAWRDRDIPHLIYESHKLTGLAASFGAVALAAAADRVDRACRETPAAPTQAMLDEAGAALDPALRDMAEWRVGRGRS